MVRVVANLTFSASACVGGGVWRCVEEGGVEWGRRRDRHGRVIARLTAACMLMNFKAVLMTAMMRCWINWNSFILLSIFFSFFILTSLFILIYIKDSWLYISTTRSIVGDCAMENQFAFCRNVRGMLSTYLLIAGTEGTEPSLQLQIFFFRRFISIFMFFFKRNLSFTHEDVVISYQPWYRLKINLHNISFYWTRVCKDCTALRD